jgi:hypothetical protein
VSVLLASLAVVSPFAVLGYVGDRKDIFGRRWAWLEGHPTTTLESK